GEPRQHPPLARRDGGRTELDPGARLLPDRTRPPLRGAASLPRHRKARLAPAGSGGAPPARRARPRPGSRAPTSRRRGLTLHSSWVRLGATDPRGRGQMSFSVKLWGTRGSIPTPGPSTQKYGGNTACVEIRTDSTLFICDGGTGLRELGIDLMRRHPDGAIVGHMLFSHPHWDHIQ